VPPLRERSEDIQELLGHFAALHAVDGARPVIFASCLRAALRSYGWPGNIRELSNLVCRLSVLFSGQRLRLRNIPRDLLPSKMAVEQPVEEEAANDEIENAGAEQGAGAAAASLMRDAMERNPVEDIICVANGGSLLPREGLALKEYLGDIEKKIIEEALCRTGGNVSKTAELLQLQRTTLIQKMSKLKKISTSASSTSN
jgi:sigma-54 specific flagellar transcriptional regulator A